MTSHPSSVCAQGVFPSTRWSVVLAATRETSPESAAALDVLCRAYWYPLYAYCRRRGQSPHDAQDLTQEFFSRLLEKRWLDSADPNKGRLRTFLLVALKRFLSNERRGASAQCRGGGVSHVPFDPTLAESRYAVDSPELGAEETFDRQWALALLELTVSRLREEFAESGKAKDFDALKGCLMAERGSIDYHEVAARTHVSEPTARVAVHRLRRRFRELYREEILKTLDSETDLDAELRHLAAALAR